MNSGEAVVRELGGHGLVSYALIGDTVNSAPGSKAKRPSAAC